MRLQNTKELVELDFFIGSKYVLQLTVEINRAPIIGILQSVLLDVLPQRGNYSSACLFTNSKHFLKWLAESEPFWRVIKPKADFYEERSIIFAVCFVCLWWEVSSNFEAVKD